jgi:MoaA/NifB/PqqE/SkfB family radical SAM enzyme
MSDIRKIEIVTGFTCNNNCMFCSVGDKLRSFDKTTDEILDDIDRAVSENPEEINFTGGEPSIRKDILKLVSYTKSKGIKQIRMTTNGRMFSYEKFTEDIVRAGLTGAIFSVHCPDPEIHDSLTGAKGGFEQTMKGLKKLYSLVKTIDVNTVITSRTYKLLPQNMELIKGYVRSVCIIFPTIDGHLKLNRGLIPKMKDSEEYIHKAIDVLKSAGKQTWTMNYPVCFMKGYESYSTLTELKTKMFWPHMDTILDEKRKTDCVQVEACGRCKYRIVCPGVMKGYVDAMGTDEIKPVLGNLAKDAKEAYGGAYG